MNIGEYLQDDYIVNRTVSRPVLVAVKMLRKDADDKARYVFTCMVHILGMLLVLYFILYELYYHTEKRGYPDYIFLTSWRNHMLWVLIRSASLRCLLWVPTTIFLFCEVRQISVYFGWNKVLYLELCHNYPIYNQVDMPELTAQTQIELLLKGQFDQSLYCLMFYQCFCGKSSVKI